MGEDRFLCEGWPERYALDRLTESEREEFEAHILDCERCFEEVRLADRYVGALRELHAQSASKDVRRGGIPRRAGLAIAATLAVVAVAVWLLVAYRSGKAVDPSLATMTHLREAGHAAFVSLKLPEVTYRGGPAPADAENVRPDSAGAVAILFPGSRFAATPVLARIVDAEGGVVAEGLTVSKTDSPGADLYGSVWDTRSRPSGAYRVVILSGDGSELGFAWFWLDR